jgi:hypothetical protein
MTPVGGGIQICVYCYGKGGGGNLPAHFAERLILIRISHRQLARPGTVKSTRVSLSACVPRLSGVCRLAMGECWKVMIWRVPKYIEPTETIL